VVKKALKRIAVGLAASASSEEPNDGLADCYLHGVRGALDRRCGGQAPRAVLVRVV
jgi:hypothetical protein